MATLQIKRLLAFEELGEFELRLGEVALCEELKVDLEAEVRKSILFSEESWSVWMDDELVMATGFNASPFRSVCYLWMLPTKASEKYKTTFARHSRRFMDEFSKQFQKIVIETHPAHNLSIKWLTWLGFKQAGTRGKMTVMIRENV